jgi:hypothetical protein
MLTAALVRPHRRARPSSPPRSSVLTAALTALTAARVGELGAGTVLVVALLGRALPP